MSNFNVSSVSGDYGNSVDWRLDVSNDIDWVTSNLGNGSRVYANVSPLIEPYGWGYFRVTADRFIKEDVQETLRKIFDIVKPGLTMTLNTVEGDKIYIVTSRLIPSSDISVLNEKIDIPEYKWMAHYESVLLYKAVHGH